MKAVRNIFALIVAIFIFAPAKGQQPRPGYSVISTSNAEFLQSIQVDGPRLEVPTGTIYVGNDRAISTADAALEFRGTGAGLLLPRLTTAQRNALTATAGLTIYNTTSSTYDYYDGSAWQSLSGSSSNYWANTGNYVYPATIGDSVGIGTDSPTAKLDVAGSFRIADGTEGSGYFLMSDSIGKSSWTGDVYYDSGDTSVNIISRNFYAISENITGIGSGDLGTGQASLMQFGSALGGGAAILLGVNSSSFQVADLSSGDVVLSVSKEGQVLVEGEFQYINLTEASGHVLTSDASGNATWQVPQANTLNSTVTEVTTTTTDWETLASYTMPANTLSENGNSLDIIAAVSKTASTDSLMVLFGTDTIWIGEDQTVVQSGVVRLTANSQLHNQNGVLATATEDLTGTVDIVLRAKSATIGNQTLKYFKVKRTE